ncbi:MAG: EAL domain-containing protein [Leptospiraceae bacterium]
MISLRGIRNLDGPASWLILAFLGIITIELNLIGINYDPGRSLYLPSFTGFFFACAYLCRPGILPVLASIHILRHGIVLWNLGFDHPWAIASTFLIVLLIPTVFVARLLRRLKGPRGFEDPAILLRVFLFFLFVHLAANLPVHWWFSHQAGGMYWVYRSILNSMSHATSILLAGRFFGVLLMGRQSDLELHNPWSLIVILLFSLVPGIVWLQEGVPSFFNTLVLMLSMPVLLILAANFNAIWVLLALIAHGWMITSLSARGLSPLAAGDENTTALVTYAYLIFVVLSISIINLLSTRKDQSRKALGLWKKMLTRRVEGRTRALRRELEWRREAEVLISNLSQTDHATEWLNRSGLSNELNQRMIHEKGHYVLLALENYRRIESAEGYTITELALMGLTERIEEELPSGALYARVDDIHLAFIVFGPNSSLPDSEIQHPDAQLSPYTDVANFLVRLTELCEEPVPAGEGNIPFRVRAAAVPFEASEDGKINLEESFKHCRAALELLSDDRSARWTILEGSRDENTTEFRILNEVQDALKSKRLILYYQPIHSSDGKRVIGCEALIRWRVSEDRILGPAAFIQTVERDDLIIEVGFYCARLLAQFARDAISRGLGLDYYSLNVAARQLQLGSFANKLIDIWTESGLEPSSLKVEVTESAFAGENDSVISNLQTLHGSGISIALDDFGTGYSSLSYLDRFPLDTIKVDRVFVQNLSHSGSSRAVISAIGSMAQQLDLSVIVEGIEDESAMNDVSSLISVSGWQGFHFSRPLPEADFLQYMESISTSSQAV